MIAIGIDPSVTHTGVVVLADGQLYPHAIKTKAVENWRQQAHRENLIIHKIKAIIGDYGLGEMFIFVEDYAIGGGYAKSIIPQVELGGMLRLMLATCENVCFVAPTSLKKFATTKGNANKVQVAVSLSKTFGVDFDGDDDIADAYVLARMAMASQGFTEGLTKEQIDVVAKVVAPKVKKGRTK